MANVFDDALASIGAAITDVREKVVEEGWFGRTVTDGQSAAPAEGNAFEANLAEILKEPAPTPEIARDTPEPGGGMER
jgi:hypothetical protein